MSDYTTLTDRINALPTSNGGDAVRISQVLAVVENAVPVEIDMDMYSEVVGSEELTDDQRETLAVVSTVYNLLADTAAKFAAQEIRKRAEQVGVELIPDAELFAKNKDSLDPNAVTSYHDLAHHSEEIVVKLGDIFDELIDQSIREATMGLVLSMTSDLGASLPGFEGLSALLSDDLHDGEEL